MCVCVCVFVCVFTFSLVHVPPRLNWANSERGFCPFHAGIIPQAPVQIILHVCKYDSSAATWLGYQLPLQMSKCVCVYVCVCVLVCVFACFAEQPCFTSRLLPVELRKPLCFLVWLLASVSALLFLLQHIELNWKLLELLKLAVIVFSLSGTQQVIVVAIYF